MAPKALGRIEAFLQEHPPATQGLFDKRTYVDLLMYDALHWLLELDPKALDGFTRIRTVYEAIGEDSRIQEFYASQRHFPLPDDAYVRHVQWVLGRRPEPR
jgi:hypothetical protein